MLRCNAKIWAVVVLVCIVVQFFAVSLPAISETFSQMDAVFEQRVVEEKAKDETMTGNDGLGTGSVVDTNHMFEEDPEENGNVANVEKDAASVKNETSGGLVLFILLGAFVLIYVTVVIFA